MRTWMQQVSALHKKHNIEVIWVTSGAIAWAAERTDFNSTKRSLPQKQALSAIGQPLIMDQYNLALHATGLMGAQVLLTAGDMKDRTRSKNLKNTLTELLRWKMIPILNENDAIATDEIQFGDNDSLASQVAVMMKAERLVLMTDVEGLFDRDPNTNQNARLIPYVAKIGARERKMADKTAVSSVGRGGMFSKLIAADKANKSGITAHFVRGDMANNLIAIALGQPIGTQIGGRLGSR
jgi:glutamate 5-kinase